MNELITDASKSGVFNEAHQKVFLRIWQKTARNESINARFCQEVIDLEREIERLKPRVAELETSLARIVWYYDKAKSGSSLPSMTTQAKAEHENTMFGEARKVLTNGHR
jgi:hypothetical protein